MNKLPTSTRAKILHMLYEGMSMRAVSRIEKISINTVYKLVADTGKACFKFHNAVVQNLWVDRVQCDEIWAFCYCKQRSLPYAINLPSWAGHIWTWTALDSDTKLLISFYVGGRSVDDAREFMRDVDSRIDTRFQLTTDGLDTYVEAVDDTFREGDVDFAQLVKYKPIPKSSKRKVNIVNLDMVNRLKDYQALKKRTAVRGRPEVEHISTSHVERLNLTLRQHLARYARESLAHSKRFENHVDMLALFAVFYNFCRVHRTLGQTPAMAAGLLDEVLDLDFLVYLADRDAKPPNRPKRYNTRE